MPEVFVKPDTLDDENRRFAQAPLRQPVFLNSVPKSGSHLLRNIVRMFVPVEQQYGRDFIQWANLQQHRVAFDPARPMLSWRSEEHTSELQSLMRISYAVSCLKQKNHNNKVTH